MNIRYSIAGDDIAVGIPEIDAVTGAPGNGIIGIGIVGAVAAPDARPASADVIIPDCIIGRGQHGVIAVAYHNTGLVASGIADGVAGYTAVATTLNIDAGDIMSDIIAGNGYIVTLINHYTCGPPCVGVGIDVIRNGIV